MSAVPNIATSERVTDEALDLIAEQVCPCGGGTLGTTGVKRHDTDRSIECLWTRGMVAKVVEALAALA